MPNVQMPDGAIVNMPDQLDPAMGARLRAYQNDYAIGAANVAANAREQGPIQDVIDMVKSGITHIPQAAKGLLDSLKGNPLHDPDIGGNFRNAVETITHPQQTLSSIGATLQNATPEQVGANVVAPLIAGGAAGKVAGLAGGALGPSEAGLAETASPAGQLGLRTTKPHPVASVVAGPTAGPALSAQNQAVGETILGADAGIPHGVRITPTSLEAARAAPGNVLDQGAAALPTAPLSPAALTKVQDARGPSTITKPTPNVEAQINDIESRLTAPNAQFTGAEIRATRNSLSSDATVGANSADADTRAIAKYKRGIVDALDQHVEDTMPANSAISPEMLKNARATLAKNYGLQDAIGKGGDVNLQQLAKDHRDNPNKYTGNTRTVLQFASDHPEVTGGISTAERIAPHGLLQDVADTNLISRPIGSVAQIFGGRVARNALTGPAGTSLETARTAPVAGLGGEFEPRTVPLSTEGISATPLTPKLGDILSNQRGGPPTDIGALRQLMIQPRTYTGMKPEEMAALEDAIKKLGAQPRTYGGTPLGEEF